MEPWSPTAVSPVPALGLGHLAGPSVPQLTNGQGRVFRLSPFRPLLPTQLFTAWLAVDSWGPVGACPAGRLRPRREPGGAEESSWAPPAQPRLPAHSALVCIRVSLVFLCSFYMCCCRSLSSHPCPLAVPSSQLQAPPFWPGAGEAAQWGQTSSPPTLPRCLPCPPSSFLDKQTAGHPGRKGTYHRVGEAAYLQLASGPSCPHPAIPRHLSSSRAWPLEPPGRGLFAPSPFPPRGLWF